jgi:hypothetical protein
MVLSFGRADRSAAGFKMVSEARHASSLPAPALVPAALLLDLLALLPLRRCGALG